MDHRPIALGADAPELRSGALRVVSVVCAFCSIAVGLYALAEVQPSPLAEMLVMYMPAVAVVLWADRDARRTGVVRVHDWGLFLWLAWPVLLPWYVFRTRGPRGWRLLLVLLLLAFSPWIVASLAFASS